MPDVYEGDRPFIFVSYAHADDDAVLPLLEALVEEGYRVWWDRGIELAEPFPDYIADRVHDCACFMPVMSLASLRSNWCNSEIYYSLDLEKPILPIYLEDLELPRGLYMALFYRQHLSRGMFDSDAALYCELFGARVLDPCLTSEGARRRRAKARGQQLKTTVPEVGVRVAESSDGSAAVTQTHVSIGVDPKSSLADYAWNELKELSLVIAAAESDEAGLAIAKRYGLVDEGGKLQDERKQLQLKDGTQASVRILGFRHDELVGGGRAGISFEFADVPTTHNMNPRRTNTGGWKKSGMRRWLNKEFLALLPDDLRESVAEARKQTNNCGKVHSLDDLSAVTSTSDRLWLLSSNEVYGGLPGVYGMEGVQYKFYSDKGVSTKNYGSCAKDGANSWWWLRSPNAHFSLGFHLVLRGVDWLARYADYDWGASPGFCF